MAKIDISKIDGYESMSAEEKLAALEAYDVPEPDMSGWVKKDVADRYASQAADFKRQLRERMTEDEAAKAKTAEDMAAIQAELESLRADKAVSEYTSSFMGIGYGKELAEATARAIQKGDMATMFKNHAQFVAEHDKAMKAELLTKTPTPPAGEGAKAATKEQFRNLSLEDKQKFAKEHPAEYAAMYTPATTEK